MVRRNPPQKSAPKIVPFLPDQFRRLASLKAIYPGIPHDRMGIKETAHKFASRERSRIATQGTQIFILTYIDSME